jgi:hypothetical protein
MSLMSDGWIRPGCRVRGQVSDLAAGSEKSKIYLFVNSA